MIQSVTVCPLSSSGNLKTDQGLTMSTEDYEKTGIVLYDLKGLGPEAEVHSMYVSDDREEFTNAAIKPKELTFTLWLLGTPTTDVPQLRYSLNTTFPIGKKVGISITSDYTAAGYTEDRTYYIEGVVQSVNPSIFQQIIETVEIVVKCPDSSFSGKTYTYPLVETTNNIYFTKYYPETEETIVPFDDNAFWKTDEDELILSTESMDDIKVMTVECDSTFPSPFMIEAKAANDFGSTDVFKFMAVDDEGRALFSITIDNNKIGKLMSSTHLIQPGETIRISCYPNQYGIFLNLADTSRVGVPNQNGWLYGDVNHDDKVTGGDAMTILRIAMGMSTATDKQRAAADVDGDGLITIKDYMLTLAYAMNANLPSWLNITGLCDISGEWPKLTNGTNGFIFTGMTADGALKSSVIDNASITYTGRYASI